MSAKAWSALLGGLAAALTLGVFVARSVAASEVSPVRERVAKVEQQQENDRDRLERIEDKLDLVIDRVSAIPSQRRQEP